MQKDEDAEQAFTRASDICPTDTNALVNLSVVLIDESKTDPSKLDLAIERLTTLTLSNPKECVAWDLLSQAYLRKGDKAKALDADKQYEACQKGQ